VEVLDQDVERDMHSASSFIAMRVQ